MIIRDEKVSVGDVMDIIDRRLENITMQFNYGKVEQKTKLMDAMAEAKWQMAELKMQFVDHVISNIGND